MPQISEIDGALHISGRGASGSDADMSAILTLCGLGLAISLLALLVSPEWVFRPEVLGLAQLP